MKTDYLPGQRVRSTKGLGTGTVRARMEDPPGVVSTSGPRYEIDWDNSWLETDVRPDEIEPSDA